MEIKLIPSVSAIDLELMLEKHFDKEICLVDFIDEVGSTNGTVVEYFFRDERCRVEKVYCDDFETSEVLSYLNQYLHKAIAMDYQEVIIRLDY